MTDRQSEFHQRCVAMTQKAREARQRLQDAHFRRFWGLRGDEVVEALGLPEDELRAVLTVAFACGYEAGRTDECKQWEETPMPGDFVEEDLT